MSEVRIISGVCVDHREEAAKLFWQAFSGKLSLGLGPEPKALAFVQQVLDPDHAISALDEKGSLIGVAGFKTANGAFIGGGLRDMTEVYGLVSGSVRALVLSILERELTSGTLLMDGIFVNENARGKGVGTALLGAIKRKAEELDCDAVRLDVIDINLRARALYEREGFVAGAVSKLGLLNHLFGFEASTEMTYRLK